MENSGEIFDNWNYLYTDLSAFFLNNAKLRYADKKNILYQIIDVNHPFEQQGVEPGSINACVANGVLNNARNISESVRYALQSLRAGGCLVVIEPTGEAAEILISQAFMIDQGDEPGNTKETTFLTDENWKQVFSDAGAVCVAEYPEQNHPLTAFGQKIYVVQGGK